MKNGMDEKNRLIAVEKDLNLRLRQQEAIAWLGEFALASKNLDDILGEAVRLVSETLDTEFTKVLELISEAELLIRSGVGWQEGVVGTTRVETGPETQAGYTLISVEPIIVYDLAHETRFKGHQLLHRHGIVSGMSVVIPGREKPFGVLTTHSAQRRYFVQHDTRFIKAIASILASSVERIRAEDELRRSRDELAIILNGITEGVTVQNPDGNLIFANQTAAEILGFQSPAEVLSVSLAELMSRFEMLDETGRLFPLENLPGRKALRGDPKASARIRFRVKATGEERWSIADATPVFDKNGQVAQVVNIFRDVTDLLQSEQRQKLLSEAGSLLTSSIDYQTTLANVANLIVTNLSDWCSIYLMTEKEEVKQLVVAHRDPSKLELAQEFQRRYPPDPTSDQGVIQVLRTGVAQYYPEISDESLGSFKRDDDHLRMMRELEIHSAVTVPLVARGRSLGAITLIWSRRKYQQSEVDLVNELARRAAIAIDNARLYQESQALNAELEQRVAYRTNQLETSNRRLLQEIDERRRTEAALKKSETLLNSLFESAPDSTILVNQQGVIIRVNQQVESLFGYQRDELLGKRIELLIPFRSRKTHVGRREDYLQAMATRSMGAGLSLFGLHKNGNEIPVDIMLSPIQMEDREQMVICAIRNMTEQRKLQEELSETHRRLFESIEAERLNISQELHDGPIQDLYGTALVLETLRDGLVNQDALGDLQTAKDSVQGIIQSLRSMCGELRPPTLTQFGLEKAIRSHLAKVRESHPELNIAANLMNDGVLLSDRARLTLFRVYQNAISNILRHSGATEVVLDFRVEDGEVTFMIKDNGRGFSVPARWLELVRTGHFGLVGMVERVEGLGGNLSIESQPGKGTTLHVRVPLEGEMITSAPAAH